MVDGERVVGEGLVGDRGSVVVPGSHMEEQKSQRWGKLRDSERQRGMAEYARESRRCNKLSDIYQAESEGTTEVEKPQIDGLHTK